MFCNKAEDEKNAAMPKPNIFEHIFYEFDTYLRSCIYLICNIYQTDLFQKKLLIEGYRIHLRNIIEFFSNKKYKDNIIYKDVINIKLDLELKNMETIKGSINKATSHLTLARVKKSLENNINFKSYPYVKENIKTLLSLLPENVSEKYKKDFEATEIQAKYLEIKKLLSL